MEPTIKPKTTAKDFFLYLGAVVLLYVTFGSLLTLLFNYIDYIFPDALSQNYYYDPYSSAIRFSLAVLIILFPFFWAATWYLNNDLRAHPEKVDIGIKKWLIYLTLFVALGIVIGDLVVLVNTFLNGEITTRFILKVGTVLFLSGFVLYYYWLDIKGAYIENKKLGHLLGAVAATIVIFSVVGGFFIIGSPASQRMARFDQQKINDLESIQWQIVNYWQTKQSVPKTLNDLKDTLSNQIIPTDPETKQPYEYTVTGSLSFKLCALFNKEGSVNTPYGRMAEPISMKGGAGIEDNWAHGVGQICFDRTIDPERYPPLSPKN